MKNPIPSLFWRVLLVLLPVFVLNQLWRFAHILSWINFNPSSSAFMEDRLEVVQDKNPNAGLKHKWVDYPKISKNLFLSTQRTPWRKAEEVIITLMLKAVMDKRRIFDIYLRKH